MISFNAGSVAVQVTVSVTVSGNARVSWAYVELLDRT